MEKNDYLDILKSTDLRPKKINVEDRRETIIMEQEGPEIKFHDSIIKWFMEHPKPTDEMVHSFAEQLGINPDELERHIYMILSEILSEGKSKDFNGEYDPKEIEMGIEVEFEHTPNRMIAEKIAKDHLAEIKDYYTRLKKMESEAGVEESEMISELFIQASEIQSMAPGPRRNMQMLRLSISAELDAANLYEAFAELTDNMDIRKVMLEVANEEKAHIGEFEFLLEHIDVDHEKNEDEGEEEVKDLTGLGEYPGEED
jgi:hypothetical protein